jgi:hypothetical protein
MNKKYTIKSTEEIDLEAGDIVEWKNEDSGEAILFVVTSSTSNKLVGVSLVDQRPGFDAPSDIHFYRAAFKYRLTRILKAEDVLYNLDKVVAKYK